MFTPWSPNARISASRRYTCENSSPKSNSKISCSVSVASSSIIFSSVLPRFFYTNILNPLQQGNNLNNTYKFSSYLTEKHYITKKKN